MTVIVRSKRTETIRRRRKAPAEHASAHPAKTATPAPETSARTPRPARERRLANDHALYNCQCGFVFEAPVSTSVGCPHCGDTQAW